MFYTWYLLFVKRVLKQKAFFVLVLLLPFIAGIVQIAANTIDSRIKIGICLENPSDFTEEIKKNLLAYDGLISFESYEDAYALKGDVIAQKIKWGYVFSEPFESDLKQGKTKRLVKCYNTPSSFLSKITDEVVFAVVMKEYANYYMVNYLSKISMLSQKQQQDLTQSYTQYQQGEETFSFSYHSVEGSAEKEEESIFTMPIRGVCAVLLLIAGIYGGIMSLEYEKNGIFKRLSPKNKINGILISILSPVSVLAVSVFCTLLLSGTFYNFLFELFLLSVYVFSVVGFSFLLTVLLKNEGILSGILPLLSMGAVIFCPVFIDLSAFYTIFDIAGHLFLPFYYLKAITNFHNTIILCLAGMAFYILGILWINLKWNTKHCH